MHHYALYYLRIMRLLLRIMRKKRPVDALFPKTRRDILAATYGQADRWWYLSELAEHLRTRPSSLQRELRTLATSGLLRRRQDGRRTYFQAESESPIYAELRGIVAKTMGIASALQDVMRKFGDRVACAFLYGSVAHREEHALSDADIVVIGSVGLSDLSPALRTLEKKFGREFNATCYSPAEFRRKAKEGNHFVLSVLSGEKVFLKGDKSELESLAGRPLGAGA